MQMVKFKDFSMPLRFFQGKFYFQGRFKTVLYIQVLFKPVPTLYYTLQKAKKKGTDQAAQMLRLILYTFVVR